MPSPITRVIIDFDGTLTAEEDQVEALAGRALTALAEQILGVAYSDLAAEYTAVRSRLLAAPLDHAYW